jgi:tetratricopeptide (TPR) repeat protein
LTPDVQTEREALGLLEFLFAKPLRTEQVIENLRDNKSITEAVREKAIALTEVYAKGLAHQQAFQLVDSLFAKLGLKRDVIERVRQTEIGNEEVRQQALALAEARRQDPMVLNEASWAVVRKPSADASAYRLALRQAEEACRLAPDNGDLINTLGVAQYRAGQYQPAVETLAQSERLNAKRFQGSIPSDLAFLAMAHHRLGQTEKALDYLNRLRETMKKPRWTQNEEAQGFVGEAETLVQGPRENRPK